VRISTAWAGRSLKNDLWIGAAAAAKGAVLLTTDEHFTRLDPTQLSCEYIDPGLLP
jgi:predicted nucleic acid-binding protein